MLIRTKQEIPEEWGGPLTPEEEKLPWFDVSNLTTFSPYQVVDWDETHQDILMPGCSGKTQRDGEYQVRFYRTPDGKIDPTGGEQEGSKLGKRRYRLTVKYDKNYRRLAREGPR